MFKSRRADPPKRQPKLSGEDQTALFRRSRTLTGSTSSQITASGETRGQLKSPRLKEHELKNHRRLLLGGLVGVVMLGGLCMWLLDQYIGNFQTVAAVPQTVRTIDRPIYETAIQEYLNARPLERFRFNLNEQQLTTAISAAYPEVATVLIDERDGLGVHDLALEFRNPVAAWQVNSTKYYVDAKGEAFMNNMFSEPPVSVRDDTGVSVASSQLVASQRLLTFLGQTVSGLNTAGLGNVTQVTIPGGTLRQLDITVEGRGYRIKTNMDREPTGQVADIVSALRHVDRTQLQPEYLDVRVSGKAYYR